MLDNYFPYDVIMIFNFSHSFVYSISNILHVSSIRHTSISLFLFINFTLFIISLSLLLFIWFFFILLFISHLPFYSSHSFLTTIPSLFRLFLFHSTFFPLFFASFLTFLSLCFVFHIPNFNRLSHSFLTCIFVFPFLFSFPLSSLFLWFHPCRFSY